MPAPNPFDVLDQYDDDEEDGRQAGAPDPFDVLDQYDDYGDDETPSNGSSEQPEQQEQPWWASLANGLTLNRGDDLADAAGDAAEYLGADSLGADIHGAANSMRQAQQQHPMTNAGGRLATGLGGALAAGPGIAAQAAVGAGMGALEDGTGGAVQGGITGAVGGYLGKGLGAVSEFLGSRGALMAKAAWPRAAERVNNISRAAQGLPPPAKQRIPKGILDKMKGLDEEAWLEENAGRSLSDFAAPDPDPVPIYHPAAQAFGNRIGKALGEGLDQVANWVSPPAAPEKVDASQPVMSSAVQSSLSGGQSGLPPEDEERLNAALLRGNTAELNAINHDLRMRFPAYGQKLAKRLREMADQLE